MSSYELEVIGLSLQVATIGTLIGLPIATGVGWLLSRYSMPGKSILDTFVSFPLVLPPVVTGYFLLLLLRNDGPIGTVFMSIFGIELLFTWIAATIASAVVGFPLMVRSIEIALSGIDHRLELAARTLGAGPIRTFFTITLPLGYRGIIGGGFVGFARALGEFGATIVVAGNIPGKTQTAPLYIFNRILVGDDDAAIRLIVASVAIAFVSLIIHSRLTRSRL